MEQSFKLTLSTLSGQAPQLTLEKNDATLNIGSIAAKMLTQNAYVGSAVDSEHVSPPVLLAAVGDTISLTVRQVAGQLSSLTFTLYGDDSIASTTTISFEKQDVLHYTCPSDKPGLLIIAAVNGLGAPHVLGALVLQPHLSSKSSQGLGSWLQQNSGRAELTSTSPSINEYFLKATSDPHLSQWFEHHLPRSSSWMNISEHVTGTRDDAYGVTDYKAYESPLNDWATRGGDSVEADHNTVYRPSPNYDSGGSTDFTPSSNKDISSYFNNLFDKPQDAPVAAKPAEPRQLLVQTQEEVNVGEEFALTVQVATTAAPTGPHESMAPIPLGFAGQLQIELMTPRGLEAITPRSQLLTVPLQGDSPLIRFGLRAKAAGVYTITVNAWNGAAHITSVKVVVSVAQATASTLVAPPGAGQASLDMRTPHPGEYTLEIDYDDTDKTYAYRLRREKEVQKPMISPPLISKREQILGGLNELMNNLARNKLAYTDDQARDRLEGIGALMFQQLLPERLQKTLWKARKSMTRLNLIAPSDQMPWEMLFLMNPEPEAGEPEPGIFLADATTVVRWVYGDGAPHAIRRAPAYVVIPENSPLGAQQEQAAVELVCGKPSLVSDLDSLTDLTRKGTFRWLHFAAHNITLPDQFGTSYIPFGKSAFSMDFMASIPGRRYAADQPLVFMNACTTAGKQPLFTEMGGWADTFLQRGAGAFVGSLWEVRTLSAAAFAGAFYQALKAGSNLGEAMRLARTALTPGDPTYLAYTLYGDPNATVQ